MAIHIHIHDAAPKRKAKDAVSVPQAQADIAKQERLIAAIEKQGKEVPGQLITRLKFLKEELDKAKARTGDGYLPFDKLTYAERKELIKKKFPKLTASQIADYAQSKWTNLPNDIKREVVHSDEFQETRDSGEVRYKGYVLTPHGNGKFNIYEGGEGKKPNLKVAESLEAAKKYVDSLKTKDSTFTGTESAWQKKVKDAFPAATFRPRPTGKVVAKVGDKDVGEYNKEKGAGTIEDGVRDEQKPYVSQEGKEWVVLNSTGKMVTSFKKEDRERAQLYLKTHWKELGGK